MTKGQAEALWKKLQDGDTRIFDFVQLLSAKKRIVRYKPTVTYEGSERSAASFLREWAKALEE